MIPIMIGTTPRPGSDAQPKLPECRAPSSPTSSLGVGVQVFGLRASFHKSDFVLIFVQAKLGFGRWQYNGIFLKVVSFIQTLLLQHYALSDDDESGSQAFHGVSHKWKPGASAKGIVGF